MNPIQLTSDLFRNGGLNCAQAIMTAFGGRFGMSAAGAKTLGRVLNGGIVRTGGICGYLTGALLVLSQAFDQADESAARARTYPAAEKLLEQFRERYGALECKQLLGADLSTAGGRLRAAEAQLVARRCPAIGEHVAALLSELLSAECPE